MGCWSGVCIFDYSAFTQIVIPAMQSGEEHPIVRDVIARLNTRFQSSSYPEYRFQGLQKVVATCDARMESCSLGKYFRVLNGDFAQKNTYKSETDDYWTYEDFTRLFEWLLNCHTITHFYVFGKKPSSLVDLFPAHVFGNRNPHVNSPYSDYLCNFSEPYRYLPEELVVDGILYDLVEALDWGIEYWKQESTGPSGIGGWLNPDDTELLWLALQDLPTNQQAPSPPEGFIFHRLHEKCYSNAEYVWHWEQIDVFRSVVQMAVNLKCGLLWGRDLEVFYECNSSTMFGRMKNKPIDLRGQL